MGRPGRAEPFGEGALDPSGQAGAQADVLQGAVGGHRREQALRPAPGEAGVAQLQAGAGGCRGVRRPGRTPLRRRGRCRWIRGSARTSSGRGPGPRRSRGRRARARAPAAPMPLPPRPRRTGPEEESEAAAARTAAPSSPRWLAGTYSSRTPACRISAASSGAASAPRPLPPRKRRSRGCSRSSRASSRRRTPSAPIPVLTRSRVRRAVLRRSRAARMRAPSSKSGFRLSQRARTVVSSARAPARASTPSGPIRLQPR